MANFQKTWSRQETPTISERIGSVVRPKGPLKPRIRDATKMLKPQIRKLDSMLGSLQKRDAALFQRVVDAVQKNDQQTSKILGNELAEIRKVTKVLGGARTALERIELRLTTCSDLGDTVVTIMPTISLMKSIKSSLGRVMPGAEQELTQMAEMLDGLMTESFAGDTAFGTDSVTSAETDEILKEAAAIAGTSTGQMFPSVPTQTQDVSTAAAATAATTTPSPTPDRRFNP